MHFNSPNGMPMLAKLNGTEIYFDFGGTGLRINDQNELAPKPVIVALHGGPGLDHTYLRYALGALHENAQLLYVDLRGQGRSGRPDVTSCTLEQMADDVAALCHLLGIDRPILFGHSAGGFIALKMAIQHPDVVAGLILCDTAAVLAPVEDNGPPAPTLASRASPEVMQVAARLFAGDFSTESVDAFFEKVMPFYGAPAHMDVPQKVLRHCMPSFDVAHHFFNVLAPYYDVRPELPDITVPTLIMVGQYDWVSPPRASRVIARGIPGSRLVEFTNSGHLPFCEEPEKFETEVRSFLASIPSTPK
jgi:proline iminopeptidase